ncbi:MAG: DUF3662 domain-containing protein [Selenomonadaceae bacterium]|nr:DUF3662 domain-containing protein [Selenomonadaceae bacterium]
MKLFSRELNPGALLKRSTKLTEEKIKKALLSELKKRRKKGVQGTRVPNNYTVLLSAEDYGAFATRRTIDNLLSFIKKQAVELDIYIDDKIAVIIKGDSEIPEGKCKISSMYAEEKKSVLSMSTDTVIVEKSDYTLPITRRVKHIVAQLVLSTDEDRKWLVGEDKLYIGRQEKNDVCLEDNTISRLHSYILYEKHRHVIYDADSLNGTYVNGDKIESHRLNIGDEILFGQTKLIYRLREESDNI